MSECTICNDHRRASIDAALAASSIRQVAEDFDLPKSTVGRHRQHLRDTEPDTEARAVPAEQPHAETVDPAPPPLTDDERLLAALRWDLEKVERKQRERDEAIAGDIEDQRQRAAEARHEDAEGDRLWRRAQELNLLPRDYGDTEQLKAAVARALEKRIAQRQEAMGRLAGLGLTDAPAIVALILDLATEDEVAPVRAKLQELAEIAERPAKLDAQIAEVEAEQAATRQKLAELEDQELDADPLSVTVEDRVRLHAVEEQRKALKAHARSLAGRLGSLRRQREPQELAAVRARRRGELIDALQVAGFAVWQRRMADLAPLLAALQAVRKANPRRRALTDFDRNRWSREPKIYLEPWGHVVREGGRKREVYDHYRAGLGEHVQPEDIELLDIEAGQIIDAVTAAVTQE